MSRLGAPTKSGIVDVKQGGRTRNWESTTQQVGGCGDTLAVVKREGGGDTLQGWRVSWGISWNTCHENRIKCSELSVQQG
jgi:hypothetical protein